MNTSVSISYIYLDPEVSNPCQSIVHKTLLARLNERFQAWRGFHEANPKMDLGLVVAMNLGIENLQVKGPTRFKGMRTIDYTIYLPTKVRELVCSRNEDIEQYVSLVLEGFERCLEKYNIASSEFEELRSDLLRDLGVDA